MKVYLITDWSNEDTILGIYSTPEKANKAFLDMLEGDLDHLKKDKNGYNQTDEFGVTEFLLDNSTGEY